jgi:hypothetical protein
VTTLRDTKEKGVVGNLYISLGTLERYCMDKTFFRVKMLIRRELFDIGDYNANNILYLRVLYRS